MFFTVSGASVDPTNDVVQFAFMANNQLPGSTDWVTGSWEKNTNVTPTAYHARCLVGPGGAKALTAGTYSVYVKVTDSPEIPVKYVGDLAVI